MCVQTSKSKICCIWVHQGWQQQLMPQKRRIKVANIKTFFQKSPQKYGKILDSEGGSIIILLIIKIVKVPWMRIFSELWKRFVGVLHCSAVYFQFGTQLPIWKYMWFNLFSTYHKSVQLQQWRLWLVHLKSDKLQYC